MVVESAGKALVLFSGGEMQGEGDIIDQGAHRHGEPARRA